MTKTNVTTDRWIFFLFALLSCMHANAADVYISAKEKGLGVLLASNRFCFVVTAYHVVKESEDITLIAPDRSEAKATLFREFGDDIDIAVLRVSENSRQFCKQTTWPMIFDLSQKIEDAQFKGYLELRDEFGKRKSIHVEIIRYSEDRYIEVRPSAVVDVITKGMSGGLLVINGIPAGILTQVLPNKGVGRVIRQDFLYGLLRNLVEEHKSIGKVEQLLGQYVMIKLFTAVPVGTEVYVLTASGRKILLKISKVHLDYASAQFLSETYSLMKGDAIYERERQ